MTTHTDLLLSVLLNGRYFLAGDEEGGVGLECRDHLAGGPLAYYRSYAGTPIYPGTEVVHVDSIPGLLAVAADHETHSHAGTEVTGGSPQRMERGGSPARR